MKKIGFTISHKENEFRRALLPEHLNKVKNCQNLYFEEGYGDALGFRDEDFIKYGCKVVTREIAMKQDVVCDPKIGDGDYIHLLNNGTTLFGWIHAVQNREITDILVKKKLSAIAWEDMFENGRHLFWRNNEIAGEAAILHAISFLGIMPYETKVAIIGRGNIGRGAYKILSNLGADITVYDRKTEKLLRKELAKYDIVVNAILWDTERIDHIIFKEDLDKMKNGSMIIDISCDKNGGIETSIPTTIENPIYIEKGVIHYVVDHTPSLFYKTVSHSLSEIVSTLIDQIIEGNFEPVLEEALIIENGHILDQRIIDFQDRVSSV